MGRPGVILLLALTVAACGGEESSKKPSESSSPAVSRDGKWIAFTSDDAIHVAQLGRPARRITDPGEDTFDHSPDWSSDGAKIVFVRIRSGENPRLYLVKPDGTGLERLTEGDAFGEVAPSWSPNGRTIAFERLRLPEDDNVYTIDAGGSNERLLLRDAGVPAWSPDGSKVAFVEGFDEAIAVLDLGTKTISRVVRSNLDSTLSLEWSPDGTRVAFDSGIYDASEIYVVNVESTRVRRLTKNREVTDQSPTWLPNGRIVFASDRGGRMQLYVMESDGTGVRRLR